MLVMKTVRLPKNLVEKIDSFTKSTGYTSSEITRMAIERGLQDMEIFKDFNLNDTVGIGKDLPMPFKRLLLDHAMLMCMLTDALEIMNPNGRATPEQLMERAISDVEKKYFSEPVQEKKKRKWF